MGYYKDNKPDILDSWKEISSYLDKSEKTCRNWAQSLDLPIHRIGNSPKARVYAYKDELDTWLKESDDPEIIKKGQKNFISPQKALSILILLVIFIIPGYIIFKNRADTDISLIDPGRKPSLAVVDFENRSGDRKLDNWRDAFSELLTIDLSQSKYIKVLRSDEVYGIKKKLGILGSNRYSTDDLKSIAEKGGVTHILKGSYVKAGESYMITAILINAVKGETICSLLEKADNEKDIFPVVDRLSENIRSELILAKDQAGSDIDIKVGRITTTSPEALFYYIEGRQQFYSWNHRKSIDYMEEAVKIDPEFAMAYRSMARSYFNIGYPDKRDEFLKIAFHHSEHLPLRERYIVQGDHFRNDVDQQHKAVKAYQKVLANYPDDEIASVHLSDIYGWMGEWDKGIELLERFIQNKIQSWRPYATLAYFYQMIGHYGKAGKVLKYYLDEINEHPTLRNRYVYNFIIQRDFERAKKEADKFISLHPKSIFGPMLKGDIYFYNDDFENTEKEYEKRVDTGEIQHKIFRDNWKNHYFNMSRGMFRKVEANYLNNAKRASEAKLEASVVVSQFDLGYLYWISGRYDECIETLNKTDIFRFSGIHLQKLYYIAVSYLELEDEKGFLRAEQNLKRFIRKYLKIDKKIISYDHLLQGVKGIKKGDYKGAVIHISKALQIHPKEGLRRYNLKRYALFYDAMAKAYLGAGDLENAEKNYRIITNLTIGREWNGDVYAKAYYHLGKIFQKQNKKDEAEKNFNKFIELWKDCDPEFRHLVKDAGKRVKELKK